MQTQINKKIYIYILLFIFLGTLNNKNFKNILFPKIIDISISGLNSENNLKLLQNLDFLKFKSLFILNDSEIKKKIENNNLVEIPKKIPTHEKSSKNISIKILSLFTLFP